VQPDEEKARRNKRKTPERHALRVIVDRFVLGPPGRLDAPAQLGELCLWKTDMKRAKSGARCNLR
jgi:hypothetical protein